MSKDLLHFKIYDYCDDITKMKINQMDPSYNQNHLKEMNDKIINQLKEIKDGYNKYKNSWCFRDEIKLIDEYLQNILNFKEESDYYKMLFRLRVNGIIPYALNTKDDDDINYLFNSNLIMSAEEQKRSNYRRCMCHKC